MSKNLFTEFQFKELENSIVQRVSDWSIPYQLDFKVKAVKEYHNEKTPSQIFIENSFNIDVIGKDHPKTPR
ncbi:hypothetical protein V7103_11175 [Neobacillus drentensis]|uniref:hypothetical protein n=1 Tax=Neobacillus drentensis TaxID=220684 RepID=UPI003000975F